MGIKATQNQKTGARGERHGAGASELRPATMIQGPKPMIKAEIA